MCVCVYIYVYIYIYIYIYIFKDIQAHNLLMQTHSQCAQRFADRYKNGARLTYRGP